MGHGAWARGDEYGHGVRACGSSMTVWTFAAVCSGADMCVPSIIPIVLKCTYSPYRALLTASAGACCSSYATIV